jgi:hypothetical protein
MDASSDVGKAHGASRSFAKTLSALGTKVHIYTEGMMDPRQKSDGG